MASKYNSILLALILAATTAVHSIPVESNTVGRKLMQTTPATKTRVVMNNNLEGKENMEVHCQDSNEDFGIQQVPNAAHYTIEFWPGANADYYCTFLFNEISHKFDVYISGRDAGCGVDRVCTWNIKESGPCFQAATKEQCYPWNQS